LKSDIESQIPGSAVTWIRISWTKAEVHTGTAYDSDGNPITIRYYVVSGMMVEAIVKNNNAGMTGAEIFIIILAFAILAAVIAFLAWGTKVVWDIMDALNKLGPAATAIGGIVMFLIIIIAIVLVLGVGFSYSGKKRSFSVGRAARFFCQVKT
jgi:hypothetical protein